jgi:pimeloyl-ACP methyl ester carboxylesterase
MVLALAGVAAAAAGAPADAPREQARQYMALQRELMAAFRDARYEDALALSEKMAALVPDRPEPPYNIACAQARLGRRDEAFKSLAKAVALGYDDPAHMREDPDLEGLRGDPRFEALAAKAREAETKGDYDRGAEMPGVRTVEGFPEGGLRFRLRMPPGAMAERPCRLVVWLHPAGGAMNDTVEGLVPMLHERGWALLVFTQKNFAYWTEGDGRRLRRTLPEVAKVPGLDARRPVLFGYSAGGQMALELYRDKPGDFGGLVLDAAYPIRTEGGRITLAAPPADAAAKDVPIYALVGTRDGGSVLWNRAETSWREAGVPLSVEYVAGKGHAWLVGKAQAARIGSWLAAVAAGKKPIGTVVGDPPVPNRAEQAL